MLTQPVLFWQPYLQLSLLSLMNSALQGALVGTLHVDPLRLRDAQRVTLHDYQYCSVTGIELQVTSCGTL